MFFIAEIFRLCQAGEGNTGTGSGRFVHLTVNKHGFRFVTLQINNPGFNHFVIEVIPFAGAFADTGKYGIAAVAFGNIVNQFHNQNGFADTGAAEQTDFAAFGIRFKQIDYFNAGGQNFRIGGLLGKAGAGR